MKAAMGEANLTVITIIAIALVIGFFTFFLWPMIQDNLESNWTTIEEGGTNAGW